MPKLDRSVQAEFEKAYKAGDLRAMVQLARETLATQLFTGRVDDDPGTLINLLRGERDREAGDPVVEQWADLFAALAMGIALGQLIHPDVFGIKGAR